MYCEVVLYCDSLHLIIIIQRMRLTLKGQARTNILSPMRARLNMVIKDTGGRRAVNRVCACLGTTVRFYPDECII